MPRERPSSELPAVRQSLWLDGLTGPRFESFPAAAAGESYDIAVVGGGVAGMLAASRLAKRGLRIAVVESERVGRGVTGYTSGKVSALQQTMYTKIGDEKAASLYAEASNAGRELIEQLVTEHSIDCNWEVRDAWTYAGEESQADAVEVEIAAAVDAGLEVTRESSLPLGIIDWGGARLADQAQFNAAAFVSGLAGAITAGAESVVDIFENTRVTGLRERRDGVELKIRSGVLRADRALIASHFPFADRGGFFARLAPQRSYVIACELEDAPPEGMFITAGSPVRSLRTAVSPDGKKRLLLIGGEGHRVGTGKPERSYERLSEWASERFSVGRITHAWSTQDNMTNDHLPMVGRLLPSSEKVFVATGFNKWGFTTAGAAAIELEQLMTDEAPRFADIFNPWRPSAREAVGVVGAGLKFAEHFTFDHIAHRGAPTCTHMGCKLKWNDGEDSWDCPCHGSRFDAAGRVLQGPATEDLDLS
jgi:glycine/D-amino acid oxidase-like deaminating enzyme